MSGRLQGITATAWLCAGLLLPGVAAALGLGEARVNSYLNQPLDAHIHLIDLDDPALDSLAVRPGTADDYRRVGLDLGVLGTPLDVVVDRDVSPPVVRVTSKTPISEPVMQILVYARWNSGRVLREYTLFLDPPLLDVAPSVAHSEPVPSQEINVVSSMPGPAAREAPRAAAPPSNGHGRLVQAGDTLWSIAYQWRPDASLDMNQVLLAFQAVNPHAFVDGNVNHLQRGVELKFPDLEDVRDIDVRRAEQEIQAQMQAWQGRPASDLPELSDDEFEVAELQAGNNSDDDSRAGSGAEASGRLSLVPPEAGGEGAGDPLGDPEAQAEIRRLRGVLARTDEEVADYPFESREVSSRAAAMREGIEAREQGLGITDSELADLEDALRAARLAAAEQAARASGFSPVIDRQAGGDEDVMPYPGSMSGTGFGELAPGMGIGPAGSESIPATGVAADNAAAAQEETPEMRAQESHPEEPPPADNPVMKWIIWVVLALALAGTVTAMFLISRGRQPRAVSLDDVDEAPARPDESAGGAAESDETARARILADGTGGESAAPESQATMEFGDDSGDIIDDPSSSDDIFALDENEADVKLELARAYLSMGDHDAARALLVEVGKEGSPEQQERARRMMAAL